MIAGCTDAGKQKQYVIGFSQCVDSDVWRRTMLEGMKRELSFYPDVRFIYKQADGNSPRQIQQVKELLQEKIDVLIISPNEAQPLTPIVEETFNKGIPVIVVDRKTASSLYSAYVGGDNYEIGKMAGQYTANLLHGKGYIIEITGLPKSSPAMERHNGFADALKMYPQISIITQVNGEWLYERAKSKLDKIAGQYPNVNLVFAHNDRMAFATHEVYSSKGNLPVPKIIGVDGLPEMNAGMQLVADKTITATMLYPTGGEEAIQIAMKILSKKDYKKENLLQTTVIDSSNVRLMQLQADKVSSQQRQIERQQTRLGEQTKIYNNQRTYLYILCSSLALAVILGGLAFYSLNENRKINKKLRLQNLEISEQQNQLIQVSAKAQAANEAKVNFFTNISHEFRTPLTLILGPLEELLADKKNTYATRQSLTLIQKNVIRLLRLFNQLIDFRKIEAEKMKLRATENDLVTFIAEIIESYKSIAKKRAIDLRFITAESSLTAWFDTNMLDKVIFNLLSNAFKFTRDNGLVHVYISKSDDGTSAIIKVQDNGVGISKEALLHVFEPFYQGDYENYKGSGIGLALSKELIQLHKGDTAVQSDKNKGAIFTVHLPLGKVHLKPEEMQVKEELSPLFYEDEKIYLEEVEPELSNTEERPEKNTTYEHTILIVEDYPDLRKFLAIRLSKQYEIVEADNSQTALQQGFDVVPDLIICDVVIPGKDGMELTNIFKSDVRTSHIPVILLTAKTAIDQQIEGMKSRADVYLTKPFNLDFLEETIKSLLINRAKLKEHYTGELTVNLKSQTVNKPDRKFIHEFMSLVESNIDNEEFSAEDICKNMGISRVQLYRKVKALLDINVNDYIVNTRLQKAKYLLQNEELTIGEIAYKVGFSTPAYFSTVFKSKFGVTPKAFKEK